MSTITQLGNISVIIPVGNLARDKQNLLELINKWKTTHSIELIIVLDFLVQKDYEREFVLHCIKSGIKIVYSLEKNPNGSRRLGYLESTGKWIIFCDSDDTLDFSRLQSVIHEPPSDGEIYVFSFAEVKLGKNLVSRTRKASTLTFVEMPGLWRCLFNRRIVDRGNFCRSLIGEDLVLLSSLILLSKRIVFNTPVLYNYVMHSGFRLSNQKPNVEEYRKTLSEFEGVLSDRFSGIKYNNFIAVCIYLSFTISCAQVFKGKLKFQIIKTLFLIIFRNPPMLLLLLPSLAVVVYTKVRRRVRK